MRCDEAVDEDHEHAHQQQGGGVTPDAASRGEVGHEQGWLRIPRAGAARDHGLGRRGIRRPGSDRVRVLRATESLALAEARCQAVCRLAVLVGGRRLLPREAAVPRVRDRVVGPAIEGKSQQRAGSRFGQVDLVIRHPHYPSRPDS